MAMWCVFGKRGEVLAGAVVSDEIMQGVVRLCEGAWYDPNRLCKCFNHGYTNFKTCQW